MYHGREVRPASDAKAAPQVWVSLAVSKSEMELVIPESSRYPT